MSKLLLMNNVAKIEDDLDYFCMYSENFDNVPEKYRWNRIYQYNGNKIEEMYNIPANTINIKGDGNDYWKYYPSGNYYEKYKNSVYASDYKCYFGICGNVEPSLDQYLQLENIKYNDKIYIKIIAYKYSTNNYSDNGRMYYSLIGKDKKTYISNDINKIGGYYTPKEIIIDLNNYKLDKNQRYKFCFYFLGYTGSSAPSYFRLLELWVNYDNYLASIK